LGCPSGSPNLMTTRRHFLSYSPGAAAALSLSLPALARQGGQGALRVGMISDIHHDVMHDGMERLGAFLEAMREAEVDLIFQLGDFCKPIPANRPFLDLWSSWEGEGYHVIGNHDMDGGVRREQTVEWLGMPGRHYAFDRGGLRFLVLDGNDPGGTQGGYHRFIAEDQQGWLEGELSATKDPVVVLIHQPLDLPGGVVNQEQIRAILERDRGPDHAGVAAVFSGHCHEDCVNRIGGIAHVQINSASYVWLPAHARRKVYDEELHEAHPYLDRVAPYRAPLWALVTIDLGAGTLTIEGRETEWVGPDPWERGAAEKDYPRARTRPAISDWAGAVYEGGERSVE